MRKQAAAPPPKLDVFEAAFSMERLRTWFPDLDAKQLEGFVMYLAELAKFNKAVNLVSSNTIRHADSIHMGDSILASRLVAPRLIAGEPLFDFGSGNGFPGVVFAALYPSQSVILVDRDQRKMEFCRHVIGALKLKNISIQQKGVEELPLLSVKNVIARGYAPFGKALITSRKHIGKGGRFFHMKSDGWANELASMPSQIFSHWSPSLLGHYKLPDSSTEMFVVLTDKIAE